MIRSIMGPQLVLSSKDCRQETRLRENQYINKGIDGCTFYGGQNSRFKRHCNQYQSLFKKKTENEYFPSPKRNRIDKEDLSTKIKEANGGCSRPRGGTRGSVLSILENEDENRTSGIHSERRAHTWKVKTSDVKSKSLSKLRVPGLSSAYGKREFGKDLPRLYGSAKQCLDFSNSLDENTVTGNVSNVDFTDDDDARRNVDSEAKQNSDDHIDLEGIIESILEKEDENLSPGIHSERKARTWKVKTSDVKSKSLSKLRAPGSSSASGKREFGRVLPRLYGSAKQCLDFSNSLDENTVKGNVSNIDFTDDDDKENIDSEANQNSDNHLNIEGIIESLGDVEYSPIKHVNYSASSQSHKLFEDEFAENNTFLTGSVFNTENCGGKQDTSNREEEPHQIGFPNPPGSNKCWMNATLQAVLGLEPLIRDVTFASQQLDAHMVPGGATKLLSAFLLLVKSCQKKRLPVIRSSLVTMSRNLGFLDKIFLGRCQQDAAEFLVRILDCFRDEFDKAIAAEKQSSMEKISLEDLVADDDKDPPQKTSNPITDNVGFTLKETSVCTRCEESAEKRQDHLVLFVDIPQLEEGRSPCLQDAIDDYMKPDTREITCSKCSNSERSVATTIQKLPRCLIIQVKRYTMQNYKAEKLADALSIPLVFSMEKYVDNDTILPSLLTPEFPHNTCSNEEDSAVHCEVPVDIESDCDDDDKDLQEAVRQSLLTHEEQEHLAHKVQEHVVHKEAEHLAGEAQENYAGQSQACLAHESQEHLALETLDDTTQEAPERLTKEAQEHFTHEALEHFAHEALEHFTYDTQEHLANEAQTHGLDGSTDSNLNERLQAVSLLPEQLKTESSISSQNSDSLYSNPDFCYTLVGAVSHYGVSPNSGHYVADVCRHYQHRWYHFDDELVNETSDKEVTGHNLQCNGYIFFYMYRPLFEQLPEDHVSTVLENITSDHAKCTS